MKSRITEISVAKSSSGLNYEKCKAIDIEHDTIKDSLCNLGSEMRNSFHKITDIQG
jgi:hypothetical protein